ncbi:MAG: sigma-70 family RNA polymerase sigma factor [Novosphingobium sp.]
MVNQSFGWPRLVFGRARRFEPAGSLGEDTSIRFRQLALPHLDAAYNYARYLSRDATVAEDIVQEAFLKAFRSIDACHGNAKAWLFAIVRNCFHDWARTNQRHRGGDCDDFEPVDEETPLTQLERGNDIAQLRAAISALPEPFRETLVLRELEDLSYREIAEATAAPIGTVMSRLARARGMLAVLLLNGKPVEKGTLSR